MSVCVCWCPLWCPCSCEGRCTESQHTGLSQRAFPKGESRAAARPHHYPVLCALRSQDPEPLLSSCSPTTHLRQTTGCVSSGLLAFRAGCFSLSLCQPDRFGPDEHTRLPRHCTSQTQVCGLCSTRLDPHLEGRDRTTGVCLRNSCPCDSSRLISPHLEEMIASPLTLLGCRNAHHFLSDQPRIHRPSRTINGEGLSWVLFDFG